MVLLGMVQAVLLVGLGIAVLLVGDRDAIADALEVDLADVALAGGLLVAIGLLQALVAVGLASGRELMRSVVGVVATVELAPAVYALVALQEVRAAGVVSMVLSVGVLWLLYGSNRSQAFFAS